MLESVNMAAYICICKDLFGPFIGKYLSFIYETIKIYLVSVIGKYRSFWKYGEKVCD